MSELKNLVYLKKLNLVGFCISGFLFFFAKAQHEPRLKNLLVG